MKVDILASGSSGNCIAITSDNGKTILVDAGIAKTKIEKRLLEVGINATEINAIFITHAHNDHIKGIPLANKYRIPVWASEGEWKSISGVDERLQRIIVGGLDDHGCGYEVQAFRTHHDAYSPVGYAITLYGSVGADDKKVSICLDTGHVDADMLEAMKDSDVYIIESNHEPSMVEASNYPLSIQARILSDNGHLSNEQTAEAIAKLVQGRGERIYLTHLSSSNNTPTLAENTVKLALFEKGLIKGKHYHLEVF